MDDDGPHSVARPTVLTRRWVVNRGALYLAVLALFVIIYVLVLRSFGDSTTRESDTVGATGVLFSALTLLFVAFQIDIALRIADTQNALIEEQTRLAMADLSITKRQTTILERQDALLSEKSHLWLGFQGGADTYRLAASGNTRFSTTIPLMILNTGEKPYLGKVNIELYLRLSAEDRKLGMQASGFTAGSNMVLGNDGEQMGQYTQTADIVSIPGEPHNLTTQISFPAPNSSTYQFHWRIVSPDGVFPSRDKAGVFYVVYADDADA